MQNQNTNVNFGGLLLGLLTILFIGLKLTGHINWSWWWVLAPSWMPLAFAILVGILYVILFFAYNKE